MLGAENRRQLFLARAVWVIVLLSGTRIDSPYAFADEPAPAAVKITFEGHVLPIFKAHCLQCHAGAEPERGLRLTSRQELLRGGATGPAIRIAAAESSLLWEKLAGNSMPKGGPPLTAEEKGIIRSWINDGAVSESGADADENVRADLDPNNSRDQWSLRPLVRPLPPTLRTDGTADRLRNTVDLFIADSLANKGLVLSADASREALARRTHFDLLGLPPSADEVDDYSADSDPTAYERLLDRLLASPHHGERWGRHWLDVAGYADSAGVLAEDRILPNAFRYRDYVMRALNADKPYDRFLQEQLAGDELSNYWQAYETLDQLPEGVIEAITATGFLRCAPDSSRPDFSTIKNADAQYFYPTINDTLQIVASSTMGMTLQCARCHSHKFDPISQVEYYQVQSIFMAALRPKQWLPQMERRLLVATASQRKTADEHNGKLDTEVKRLKEELASSRTEHKQKLFDDRLAGLPVAIRDDVRQALAKPNDQRSAVEQYLVDKFQASLRPDDPTLDKLLPETYPDYRTGMEQRNAAIAAQERQRVHFDELRALYDLPGPAITPLLRRGDALTPGPAVEPGVPTAIATPVAFHWESPAAEAKTSGRRLAFARWLTQPDHPLTARVMTNRIWLHHFGEGIVTTPEDFGMLGAAPSHPQLLDWLARDFVEGAWSVKRLHRRLMTSSTYRQQSTADPQRHAAAMRIDPDNRLLWRQRFRRLDAESLRDAFLSAAGILDASLYGTPTPVARRADGEVVVSGSNDRRRSVYIQVVRSNPLSLLQVYDQPVMETNCIRRSRSTVSTQALTLMNSDSTIAYARSFAERAWRESPADPVRFAVRTAFARPASTEELSMLQQFFDEHQRRYLATGAAADVSRQDALSDVCQMLMAANEFVYLD